MDTDKNKVLNKFLAKESIKALYRLIEEIDDAVERLEHLVDGVFVGAAPGACGVFARQRDQCRHPQAFDDAAPLRIAGNAGFVGDALAGQRAGDRAVDHLAGLAAAVVAVIHQRPGARDELGGSPGRC